MRSIFSRIQKIRLNRQLKRYKKNINIGEGNILDYCLIEIRKSVENHIFLEVGKNSFLGCQFIYDRDSGHIRVGDNTYIGRGTKLISINDIDIGDNVIISWDCTIYDHNSHSIYWKERCNDIPQARKDYLEFNDAARRKDWSNVRSAPIIIKDKAWIGFGVTILKGVTIGEGAVVAAGSVVTRDVLPYTVVGGNPAVVLKRVEEG